MRIICVMLTVLVGMLSMSCAERGGSTPVADAGPDQNIRTGALVILDASGSHDADPDSLSYVWSFDFIPAGSSAALSDPFAVNPFFTVDVDGAYVLRLVVNDGIQDSDPDTVIITASTANSAPVAYAGPDQNVETSSQVSLDGSGSSDADGDILICNWSFSSLPAGSIASLSDPTVVNPTFTADVDGTYVLELEVYDGVVHSAADSVAITATSTNAAPIAVAGTNQNVETGSLVTLDGSGSSDANGDLLSYAWSFSSLPNGSNAVLSNPLAVNPSFTADLDGSYVLHLIVNDGTLSSALDAVTVTAATTNLAPVAEAGPDQSVETGSLVTLDGSGSSDANGDLLSYAWSFSSLPNGSNAVLSNPLAVNPSFTVDLDGAYVLNLIVDDGDLNSASDTVTIIAATTNLAPVAEAGPGQSVETGLLVTLDGSGSSDANSDLLTYSWSFTSIPSGSSASLSDATIANPTFIADLDGSYVVSLVVNDGTESSSPDSVTITASTTNLAPVADAGIDQNVETGTSVTLDGSGSTDANGDILTYAWAFSSLPDGSGASLTGPTTVNPSFVAEIDGTYVLNLVVSDGLLSSAADVISVTASTPNSAPVADAGDDQNVATGSTVALDGSGSSDADGDLLNYSWSFTSMPEGSGAVLSDATAVNPTFIAELDGTYVLALVVDDGLENSDSSVVSISAATVNSAPVADAGPDQSVATGSLVTLDGSGSSDADNDPLTYSWAFSSIAGVQGVTLTGGDTVNPSFTAVVDGSYVINLVVNDGSLGSAPDTVIVTAATVNSAPIAEAGDNQEVLVGELVSLRGNRSSDADGDTLSFSWSFVSVPDGSTAVLARADKTNPTFTPDVAGAYVVRLVVNDGSLDSEPDTVTISAR